MNRSDHYAICNRPWQDGKQAEDKETLVLSLVPHIGDSLTGQRPECAAELQQKETGEWTSKKTLAYYTRIHYFLQRENVNSLYK